VTDKQLIQKSIVKYSQKSSNPAPGTMSSPNCDVRSPMDFALYSSDLAFQTSDLLMGQKAGENRLFLFS